MARMTVIGDTMMAHRDEMSAVGPLRASETLLTTREAAEVLDISPSTLKHMKQRGAIHPAVTSIGRVGDRYLRASLEALLEQQPSLSTISRDDPSGLLTTAQVLDRLRISKSKLSNFVQAGLLSTTGRHHGMRYRASEVERLQSEQLEHGLATLSDRSEPLRRCACGCDGTLPPWFQGRFLPGHHMKVGGQELRQEHLKVRYPDPPTQLGKFLLDQWINYQGTTRGFLRGLGLVQKAVVRLIRGELPTERTLEKLHRVFGKETLPTTKTLDDVHRAQARQHVIEKRGARNYCIRCNRPLIGRQQRFCSEWCRNSRRRPIFNPKTTLGKCVNERLEESNKSIRKFAIDVGSEGYTVSKILRDQPVLRSTAELVCKALGIDVPDDLITSNDRMSEHAKTRADKLGKRFALRTAKVRDAANAAKRGRKRSAESIEKQRKSQGESEAFQTHVGNLRARRGSPEWRARLFLVSRLRITRDPRAELLDQWLEEAVEHFKALGFARMTKKAMYSAWRRTLVKIGRLPPQGRPRDELRHQIVVNLMNTRGLTPADDMPRGFWQAAYKAVVAASGQGNLKAFEGLRQWWLDHKLSCFSCLTTAPATSDL